MRLQIPFGLIADLRQNQSRLDRIEHFREIKNLIVRIGAGAYDVGKIFFGAPLAQKALPELVAARRDRS